jgi:hypothetical protein
MTKPILGRTDLLDVSAGSANAMAAAHGGAVSRPSIREGSSGGRARDCHELRNGRKRSEILMGAPQMRKAIAVLATILGLIGAGQAQTTRPVVTKDFARLFMAAIEAIASQDGSQDAAHRADAAINAVKAEADMESDNVVRQNEDLTTTFGLTTLSLTHRTYELSGSREDADKFRACAEAYKDAIRKAVVTEASDKPTPVIARCESATAPTQAQAAQPAPVTPTSGTGLKFLHSTIGESVEEFKQYARSSSKCDDPTPLYPQNCEALQKMTAEKCEMYTQGNHVEVDFREGKLTRIVVEPGLITGPRLIDALVQMYGNPTSTQDGGDCYTGLLAHKMHADIMGEWKWIFQNGTVEMQKYCVANQSGPMYRAIIQ